MKTSIRTLSLAASALALVLAAGPVAAPALAQSASTPPTAADFGREAAINDVVISPDGKHIAALTSADGARIVISIWATDNLSAKPVSIGLDSHRRLLGLRFLKNDRLQFTTIQTMDTGGPRGHGHLIKDYVTDLEGKKETTLLPEPRGNSEMGSLIAQLSSAKVIDSLPQDPQNVLVIDPRLGTAGDVLKVNVYTGAIERIDHASDKLGNPETDLKGEIRAKQMVDYDQGKVFFAQFLKNPDTGAFEEHFRWYAKDREPTELAAFTTDPNVVLVTSSKDRDKTGVYAYDIKARKIIEPEFEHKLFNASGVVQSHAKADYGEILGFTYAAESGKVYWVDPQLSALEKAARSALGVTTTPVPWVDPGTGEQVRYPVADGADVQITGMNQERTLFILTKSGPKQPPEYYIYDKANGLRLLGRSRPTINTAAFGDTKLVEYKARDGLEIPAFLTTPPKGVYGPGPYPTLIIPHGGPWARDELSWDPTGWTQYFASRGYAVLQPQFRGSEGWGQKLWRAGDGEWGQKMQDDKDDGVKWLVEQKIAAPDRVAMFGYSYGGYAALAASIRPNGLYQCAISGAGAGDLASIRRATFDNRYQREFQNPTIRGLDALAHATEAKIPVFIYHGDRDQTVQVDQSRKFADALKGANLPYKYTEIKDMGHQYVTWTPTTLAQQLTEVENYLKTDCGPGGL